MEWMPKSRLLGFDRINHWMTWLRSLGSLDADLSYGNLISISVLGIPDDLMETIILQMEREFIRVSDVDRAINNLQQFLTSSRSPLSLATLFQRDHSALPVLLQLFSSSQHCSDLLIQSPDYFDYLRLTGGHPRSRLDLIKAIRNESRNQNDLATLSRVLRRFKHRETLRIAYGDIILGLPLEAIAEQISFVADATINAAIEFARRKLDAKWGAMVDAGDRPIPITVIALGKLGGAELNYSSDVDLMFVYGSQNANRCCTRSPQQYFDELAQLATKLLSESTNLGIAYRVDLRLRPDGASGPITRSMQQMINYYESRGRTWERQTLLKARVAAGDATLGRDFLAALEPWVYQKFLSQFEIESIRTLKRKIEHRTTNAGQDETNVKTGRGGIRDIEFAIQFLQLLYSANRPEVRTSNTLDAISRLYRADCLTLAESTILQKNYRFLRLVEHRLQLMFDLQTHRIPSEPLELRKLALRCGFAGSEDRSALEQFIQEMDSVRQTNRRILDHLLHSAFPIEEKNIESDDQNRISEMDLILDPDPEAETIANTLSAYKLSNSEQAYRRLKELSHESCRFLSQQRCRHFFAAICQPLLQRVAETPDPLQTLTELSRVADSLGNKGVLWELFNGNVPSMDLCVRLCAAAPYLTSILTGNPGMLDELMDSLLLEHLPNGVQLQEQLNELLKGAEDPLPILHSFKDAMHLLVGVRDILGRGKTQEKLLFLSDVAEACLVCISRLHYKQLVQKLGQPILESGEPMSWCIIALGKLGGQEPNYHSDLDLVFFYPHDGETTGAAKAGNTSHQHFFSRFASEVVKTLSHFDVQGRLYEVDCRLRPTGKSGALAVSAVQLTKYFGIEKQVACEKKSSVLRSSKEGTAKAEIWERQAFLKARVLGDSREVMNAAQDLIAATGQVQLPRRELAAYIYRMRMEMQKGATPLNLKRGLGGTIDIEFIVQLFQMIYGQQCPEILEANTWTATERLVETRLLDAKLGAELIQSYEFLRELEARLRLLNQSARHEFPSDAATQHSLAFLLDITPDELSRLVHYYLQENRNRFNSLFSQFFDLPDDLPS